MTSIFNPFLQQLATGDQIKDYQHASRLFVDSLYRLSPKFKSLFHVFFDLNTDVILESSRENLIEAGMLAKSVTLPKFTVQRKTLNAYNRKNVNQERINYDPVTITFHDDSANVIREFWYKYYSYYFRDSDHSLPLYFQDHKYKTRQEQNWGFSPKSNRAIKYISSIRIYSLHQKSFSSYILINPTITTFQHGQHTAGEYDLMEHTMTVEYEAVQYEKGAVSNNTVQGFSEIHYDNSPSPLTSIGGGTRSILGPGGLIDSTGDLITNLQSGNFIGAALGGARTFTNFRNADLGAVVSAEASQQFRNILRGQNPNSNVFFPTAASVNAGISRAVNAIPGAGGITSAASNLINNINSANRQLPNSNQGRTGGSGFDFSNF